ncbi:MAG: YwqG family protein [Candidatus Izemoplasmatales bacterium]|nr:YwqG family protein [bacterium]MDZ4195755.1 YwqG family protein [Candidatus Izemoplasmatales bacterium]
MFQLFKRKKTDDSVSLKYKTNDMKSLREFEDQLILLQLNSIVIQPKFDSVMKLPIGSSKIGGKPDLPIDFEWYYYKAKSLNTGIEIDRPLSFLAQFNLEEIKKYDLDNRLPNTGILYFFYEMESNKWGFDPADRGCAKVYYYNGCFNNLVSTDWPSGISDEFVFSEISLSFSPKVSAPCYEELSPDWNFDIVDVYNEVLEKKGYTHGGYSSKLLGYSDNIQGDMTLECQLVSNGLYCGDGTGYHSPRRKELEANKNQWKLLFQLDSIDEKKIQLYFGDMGRLYFYIKEEDLLNGNFDNIWFSLQCT